LGPFDYENENYVKTLWVAEGFTDYYADILPKRAGINSKEEFLNGISNQIEQVQTVPGRLVTPVNMASFDTWIKQYRPDENTANMSVNYYPKGAVIAFLLDAKIRKATNGTRSLDTGMQWAMQRYSGEKGYTPEQFYAVMSEAAGTDLKGWFAKTAESAEELDYSEALEYYGLRFRPVPPGRPVIGGGTRNDNGRLIVTSVRRGTPGLEAGLNVDDEIIAIDDVRVRADGLAARLDQYKPGDKISMLVARRDRLMKLDVTLGADPGRAWRLEQTPNATAEQVARLNALMDGK
jgi:predicted metalloprotease with PDZ domain